jgi:hypothetical protein
MEKKITEKKLTMSNFAMVFATEGILSIIHAACTEE